MSGTRAHWLRVFLTQVGSLTGAPITEAPIAAYLFQRCPVDFVSKDICTLIHTRRVLTGVGRLCRLVEIDGMLAIVDVGLDILHQPGLWACEDTCFVVKGFGRSLVEEPAQKPRVWSTSIFVSRVGMVDISLVGTTSCGSQC
jgi:hypothetical protein